MSPIGKNEPGGTGAVRVPSVREQVARGSRPDLSDYLEQNSDNARIGEQFHQFLTENATLTRGRRGKYAGMPWPTFVLGTGCLQPSEPHGQDLVSRRLDALRDRADEVTLEGPTRALGELVKQWIDDITNEDDTETADEGDGGRPAESSEWSTSLVFDIVLAAALAGRVYAEAVASFGHVLTVARQDTIRFSATDGRWSGSDFQFVQPLITLLKRIAPGSTPSRKRLRSLASVILSDLDSERLVRQDVELLNAFAWHFVTDGVATYPRWGELLLLQGLEEAGATGAPSTRPHRSSLRRSFAASVESRYRLATKDSWVQRRTGVTTARHQFYDAVAVVVRQQAALVGRMPTADYFPLPTVFVSSFDIELEMALWESGRPFALVVPVISVIDGQGPRDAMFRWITTTITPNGARSDGELPEALTTPTVWEPLDVSTFRPWRDSESAESEANEVHPIVVRLAGSPLMTLSPKAMREMTRKSGGSAEKVFHALLLDDYSAYNLAALDLRAGGDLAHSLTSTGMDDDVRRFWTFVGVQLEDPAVRLRLLAHEIVAANRGVALSEDSRWRAGIVLNKQSSHDDADAFHWYRLDPVVGTSTDLTPQLERFAALFAADLEATEHEGSDG